MRGSKLTVSRGWAGHKGQGRTTVNVAWTHPDYPGVTVLHCGHPTALWPYYIKGFGWRDGGAGVATFRALKQAQWWVERGGLTLGSKQAEGELYRTMMDIEQGRVTQ